MAAIQLCSIIKRARENDRINVLTMGQLEDGICELQVQLLEGKISEANRVGLLRLHRARIKRASETFQGFIEAWEDDEERVATDIRIKAQEAS